MKRELKPEEHEEIVRAVAAGDRVKATNLYLSATEGNLTDAQDYVKRLTAEAKAAESERSPEKRAKS
jgi:DNA-binding GntR family transcriptional regulator